MYKQNATTLSELSKPHEKLAGLRIDDNSNMTPHVTYYTDIAIKMKEISMEVTNLPNGAKIRSVNWSNDSQHICFSVQTDEEDGTGSKLKIWVANVETREARPLFQNPNTFYNPLLVGFFWTDNSTILVPIIPPNRVRPPSRPKVPFGPKIDCNEHMDTVRFHTYQELLKDEYDEDLFEYFATSELVLVSLDGKVKLFRAPAIYTSLNLVSWCNMISIEYTERPFSYFVPCKRFEKLRVNQPIEGRTVKECNRSSMDWSTKAASKHTGVSSQNTHDSGSNKEAKQECLFKKKFPYPYPVQDIKKIKFKRKDMVELGANLCLPQDYNQARDGPLPCIIWPYPNTKIKSSDKYYFRPLSPLVWLARGFAVLFDICIPIKDEDKAYDGYVEELVSTVEAAVQEVIRLGVAHPKKIVIGGHSFGATLTALLLQHASHLFCCGIALSGAYNRTLTPFRFQSEKRTFWEAKYTYVEMSPFISADKITKPILLVHGEDDSNPGTWTMQSIRFYKALIANGACCRLVILPFENHTYLARENILHVLWETDRWLQKYCVANSGARTDGKV
ncbi:unnamed protein product [Fraxinus pennsylvanica]|uniref:Peptidase S9 prolyl oligopeptidase catalytic domain-containing protein n=1 Tax=Fraxinus pennsylvanica TaxID=56036 RepID=A0AAD2A0N2_9LAMI|nr:unnamed protein product [Fraxinus pennsylvanica]